MSNPTETARRVASAKACTTSAISSTVRAAGSAYPSKGTSDGATVGQPPSSVGTVPERWSQGR